MYRPVHFIYSGPSEWEYDENGDPVRPGARELAEEIAKELRGKFPSVSDVDQHSYYGWSITTKFGGCTFFQVLNPVDEEAHFTIKLDWFWVKKLLLKNPQTTFDSYCSTIDEVLASLDDVSAIEWGEYHS